MGLPCPALAAGCAAAYLCELSPEPLPQLCRAATGDRTQGCYAAAYALCGPEARGECGRFLGMPGTISSVASGITNLRGTNYEVKAVHAELKLHAVIMPREAKSHSERRRRVSIPQRASNDKVQVTGSGTSAAMVEIVTAGAILSAESI